MASDQAVRPLGLHQITAMEASPAELVSLAAAAGCQQVCVFTHIPGMAEPAEGAAENGADSGTDNGTAPFPLITRANLAEVQARLRETGVVVSNIEFFPIKKSVPAETYRAAFALGAELGACRAVTHIHDTDADRALVRLGEVADLAAEYGLSLGLEFMGLTPGCTTLQRAVWFVEQAARPNIGVAVDALHLARTGGTPADVLAVPASLFAYAQICDAHGLHQSTDYLAEALDRAMPDTGDLPLQALIEALPAATALDVEVPSVQLADQGVLAADRVREAVDRARAIIARAQVAR